jgi:very-short-patch-repair endonuclease
MLCCVSSARAAGLWVLDEGTELHVAVGSNARVHHHAGCGCRTHRMPSVELGRRAGLVTTLVQILACRGVEEFFVVLESALRSRRLDRRAIDRLRGLLPAEHRWMLDFARDDADSGLESLLRFRLRPYGIALQSQVEIGGVGRVDFVLGDRLILEADGKPNHQGRAKRHKDLTRDAIAAGLGFTTLRFDYALIVHDWPTVLAAILTTVGLGHHLSN